MAINFPNSPSLNDTHTVGDVTWTWNGTSWTAVRSTVGAESNDLTAAVTWANVPDANITESSVTQHQAALSIAESQLTGGTLITASSSDTLTNKSGNISQWTNDSGYLANLTTSSFTSLSDVDSVSASDDGLILYYDHSTTSFRWKSEFAGNTDAVPEGTNNKYFSTSGATVNTDALPEGTTNLYYLDSKVDTHLNQSNPTSGHVLSWNGSDYAWVSSAPASLADVGDVGSYGTPSNNSVLKWNTANSRWQVYDESRYVAFEGDYGGNWSIVTLDSVSGNDYQTNYIMYGAAAPSLSHTSFGNNRVYGGVSTSYVGNDLGEEEVHLGLTSLEIGSTDLKNTFDVSTSGSTNYTFSDAGNHWFPTTENDPVLYLRRGETYVFKILTTLATSHPFEIRVSNGGSAYSTGVTSTTIFNYTYYTFKVPMSAPATLYYQCTTHAGMGNTINIV